MRKADPRAKLVAGLCMATAALVADKLPCVLTVGALAVIAALCFGVNFASLLAKTRYLITLMLVIALLQSIFTPDEHVLVRLFGINLITQNGLLQGIKLLVRMLVVIISGAIMATSDYRTSVQSLIQWHVPYELAFMSAIAIRFLPVFTQEFRDSLTALELRGVDIKKIGFKKKLKVYTYMLSPVVSGAMLRAQELSLAMDARAFRAYNNRTSYLQLSLKASDFVIMAAAAVIFAAVVIFI